MKHTYTILITWSDYSLRYLGLGEQGQNTTNGTRSKSTKRTSNVASDGFMFLAFEVCWSRGPDGIRYSDDMRNIWEGITGVWTVLWQGCIFQMMYVWWVYMWQQIWRIPAIPMTFAFEERVWLLISETPRSHEIKDKSGVVSKGWCVRGTLSSGFIKWYHWTWWWLLWT